MSKVEITLTTYAQAFKDGAVVNQWLSTESGDNSPSAKMALRCLAMFYLLVWNNSAIPV